MDGDKFPAGLRVLAVDDDRVSLMILERQLRLCKYDVTAVMDAKTALAMLRERKDGNQFDLVISDVVMPDMDGFELLELIGLEMDIPVIMLSANDETEAMMKGIKHGACDYLVKPVRLEQLRSIWTHVVRKNITDPRNCTSGGNDDAGQKVQCGDEKGEKDGANHTKKYLKKNKKDGDGTEEDKENTSTQKRQRIQWSGHLHRKFVEAVNQIGMDRAVPKKILEVMNVDGLSRENVASHLQKYRQYLKKINNGTLSHSNPFIDEPQAWQSDWRPANSNMNVPESSKQHPELGSYQPSPSFAGSSNSSSPFASTNSPSAFGTHNLLPTQSVQLMSSQRNLCVPLQNMEPVGHNVNLPKEAVHGPVQDVSKFISSGNSYATISSGGLSGASQCFPSCPSGSSFANTNSVVFNTSRPLSFGTSGNSFANIPNDSPPLATSIHFPPSRSCNSYASILRGQMLAASRGIPFDADNFLENIAHGEMLPPSRHLPLQSPELVNQPSVQIQSSSAGLFNQVSREAHQFAGHSNSSNPWRNAVPSKFPDLGLNDGTSKGPSQGNSIMINQFSTLAASPGQAPTFGNEFQNQMTGITGKTAPVVGFSEQVAPFNLGINANSTAVPIGSSALGSSSSIRSSLPNIHIDNSIMRAQILNGGNASGNLPEGGTTDQQDVGDQVNNNNEFLVGTSKAQNGASGDLDDFFADWVNQDFLNDGDAFMDGNWDFAP